MLDLTSLFARSDTPEILTETTVPQGKASDLTHTTGAEIGHSGHSANAPNFDQVCPRETLRHKDFGELGTLGTVGTVDFQGGEGQKENGAPGGGADRNEFALHPAAVVLALAYCRKVNADREERSLVLLHLSTMSPGDQVKHWHGCCVEVGLKPWEVLMLPAPISGQDCTMCKHLTTRQMAGDSGRRQFHWACSHGHLILETGRGTERIWMAPPECSSWERWVPSGRGG